MDYKTEKIKVKVEMEFTLERFANLLCNAIEGGSVYWAIIPKVNRPDGYTTKNSYSYEVPFIGGSIEIKDRYDDYPLQIIDRYHIQQGINLFMDLKYEDGSQHKFVKDFINNDCDAYTGDAFLQLCCYGKIIYG